MRHAIPKVAVLAVVAMLALSQPAAATGTNGPAQRAAAVAYFQFSTPPGSERFVFKLTDPAKIKEARDILRGVQKDRIHVAGKIVKRAVSYNPPWRYHLDPASISFFANSVEVCDATIRYVEDHLDQAGGSFLPSLTWCPWTSRLLREVPAP
jgi:hypothetical protein